MLPLQFFLPEPRTGVPDPLAPLGVSFISELAKISSPQPCDGMIDFDVQAEIAWMKNHLQTHPLVGSVAGEAPQAEAVAPRRDPPQQQEPSEIAEEEEEDEEYPESTAEYPDAV